MLLLLKMISQTHLRFLTFFSHPQRVPLWEKITDQTRCNAFLRRNSWWRRMRWRGEALFARGGYHHYQCNHNLLRRRRHCRSLWQSVTYRSYVKPSNLLSWSPPFKRRLPRLAVLISNSQEIRRFSYSVRYLDI